MRISEMEKKSTDLIYTFIKMYEGHILMHKLEVPLRFNIDKVKI